MTTALVLGGGGVTGIAWETGLLAGLAEAGLDLTGADVLVGTSAGSVVSAQLATGVPIADLYARQLAPATGEIPAKLGVGGMLRFVVAAVRNRDPVEFRKKIGAMALDADTVPESDRLAVIGGRLPVHEWPDRTLLITSANAVTGEAVVWRAGGEAGLVEAVASSCAVPGVWPPVTINGRRYVDGGVVSMVNADLAADADRIVVLAPITRGGGPLPTPAQQAAALRAAGKKVVVIEPSAEAKAAIGKNVLDPARREPSARAGHTQAGVALTAVQDVWT